MRAAAPALRRASSAARRAARRSARAAARRATVAARWQREVQYLAPTLRRPFAVWSRGPPQRAQEAACWSTCPRATGAALPPCGMAAEALREPPLPKGDDARVAGACRAPQIARTVSSMSPNLWGKDGEGWGMPGKQERSRRVRPGW